MNTTVMLGESAKYERPYTVHALEIAGRIAGKPVSLIIGDPTDSRGHKLYKTGSPKSTGVTPRKFNNAPKRLGESAWLLSACAGEDRPALMTPHGSWAADGFMMFHVLGDGNKVTCECDGCKEDARISTPDFTKVLSDKTRETFTYRLKLSRMDLLTACNQADAISRNPDGKQTTSGILKLVTDEDGLNYSSTNEETGTISGFIFASDIDKTRANNLTIAVNFEKLRAALLGMNENVTLQFNGNVQPVYVTDGEREAIVMPMHLDK